MKWSARPGTANSGAGRWHAVIGPATSGARTRVTANAWPILQGTAAASAAWVIARHLVQHHQPFFAPIAALVALNAARGERGSNALWLLQGVFVGIVTAELAVRGLGRGDATLAIATFVAMVLALALGGKRITIAQAGASAVLVVVTPTAGASPGRLIDAGIGAGIALVISQLLFPVEPVALLRRAESAVLAETARALILTARAAEDADDVLAAQAIEQLRTVRDGLTGLSQTRNHSTTAAKRSPLWWGRTSPIVQETENAGHLDLLGSSCLMLTRAITDTSDDERRALAPIVHTLAATLQTLAEDPGDRHRRQEAADQALAAATNLARIDGSAGDSFVATRSAIRAVATDTMVFAGINPANAADAIRHGSEQLRVVDPPARPWTPLHRFRRRHRTK